MFWSLEYLILLSLAYAQSTVAVSLTWVRTAKVLLFQEGQYWKNTEKRQHKLQVTFTWAKLFNFPIYNLSMSPFKTALWVGVLQSHFTKNSPPETFLYSSVWEKFSCTLFTLSPRACKCFSRPSFFLDDPGNSKNHLSYLVSNWCSLSLSKGSAVRPDWCLQCILTSGKAVSFSQTQASCLSQLSPMPESAADPDSNRAMQR